MIKVNLNNLQYRYDVYQIINLFFNLEDIDFVENEADIYVFIDNNTINVSNKTNKYEFIKDNDLTIKQAIKLAVFNFLKKITGKELPWGTLVGIRPSKIALDLLNSGMSEQDIINYYSKHYNTRGDKAKLCIDVAKLENEFVNSDKKTISVYIGMPFCPTRCLYCSFASNPISGCSTLVEPYLAALQKEIIGISKFIEEKHLRVECVYFGGGTPTAVNDSQFSFIMKSIYDNLIFGKNIKEFTVECGRPDSITEEKLRTMKNYEVNRISINPQSMNDDTLRKIGRHHSSKDVIEKYKMARAMGFDNINMDIIVGLVDEDVESIEYTCSKLYELNPDSITVHGLSIKRASKLHEEILIDKSIRLIGQSEINSMYEATNKLAASLKMRPYYMYKQKNMFGNMENIGYSKFSKEGIYNIQMIEEKQTIIAAGADAVCKIVFLEENRIERFANVKDVREYISRIDEMIDKKIKLLNDLYIEK